MNISPVGFYCVQNYSFGVKDKNSSNPIENIPSKQNNGDEVKMSPEHYYSMFALGIVNNMEKQGMLFEDEEAILEMAQDIEFDDEFGVVGEYTADLAIFGLKTVANMMGLPPKEIQKQIPVFVKMDTQNYLNAMEKQIEQSLRVLENVELPKISEEEYEQALYDFLEDDDASIDTSFIMEYSMSSLPKMMESQKKVLEQLKTTKKSKLEETLKTLADALNYRFLKVINFGFEGNARGIVSEMTNGLEMFMTPEVIDNQDGTSTYIYPNITNKLEVIKNNLNGDYISAQYKNLNNKGVAIEFNQNGSIKELVYDNETDNSVVIIKQNDNTAIVQQIFDNFTTERSFIKEKNGEFKQTSIQILLK